MKNRILPLAALLMCLALALSAVSVWAEAAGTPLLTLDQTELTLVKGKSHKLKTTLENVENPKKAKYAWATSDDTVATVDKGGTVNAKDGGTAQITCTATLEDGSELTATAAVTVTVPVSAVKITTKGNTSVAYGESLHIEYTVQPENATNQTIEWTSSNEEILRVDENGTVTALAAGKANITGKSDNGKSAKVSLYVPTLHPSSDEFAVTATDSVFHFAYCGNDFDKNVQITAKGNCFDYEVIRNDPDIGIAMTGLSVGEGTLTVSDKKDGAAKFTVKVTVTDEAFPTGKMLLIKNASYDPENHVLTVTWVNTGSVPISGAEIRINPLDADRKPVIAGEGSIEEILLEERVLHTSALIKPGKEGTVSFAAGALYPAATEMQIAVDRIEKAVLGEKDYVEERTVLELPDSGLYWYSTLENGYAPKLEEAEPYTAPAEEVFEQAGSVHIGITTMAVPRELAKAYGFAGGGLLVVAVEQNSAADHIGLEPGDMIFSVNDTDYDDEPYMMTLTAADLAAGLPVTMEIERDNEFWDLNLVISD